METGRLQSDPERAAEKQRSREIERTYYRESKARELAHNRQKQSEQRAAELAGLEEAARAITNAVLDTLEKRGYSLRDLLPLRRRKWRDWRRR